VNSEEFEKTTKYFLILEYDLMQMMSLSSIQKYWNFEPILTKNHNVRIEYVVSGNYFL